MRRGDLTPGREDEERTKRKGIVKRYKESLK
jgi:hypothetical protein